MYFAENKKFETVLFIDADNHQIVSELYVDGEEDPFTSVAASPREMVRELIESGDYDDDKLDMFLDTLYEAVEILEKFLNAEDGDEE